MVLHCGALSQVDDNSKVVRTTPDGSRRQGSTLSLNKRSRKPRTKRAFKSATPTNHNHDPLSLVGAEFLVKNYPLTILERRGQLSNPGRRREKSPRDNDRATPRHQYEIGYNEEERLQQLDKLVYRNNSGASARKRGFNAIGNLLSGCTSSSSTGNSPRHLHNGSRSGASRACGGPRHGHATRQKIIRQVHGEHRTEAASPTCPKCSGDLTYLYMSTSKQIREVQSGNVSTKEKLQSLLPPLCTKCKTHLLFENTECKFLMMENFQRWVESGFDDENSEDDEDGDEEDHYKFNDPRYARLIVVNATPSSANIDIHIATSFGSNAPCQSMDDSTPRLSNRSTASERSTPRIFAFDEAMMEFAKNPLLSGLSSLSEGAHRPYRRKGQLHYNDESKQRAKALNEGSQTAVANVMGSSDRTHTHDSNFGLRREEVSPDYCSSASDEDPFEDLPQRINDGDAAISSEISADIKSVEKGLLGVLNEQRSDEKSSEGQKSPHPQSLASKSSGGIKAIDTGSDGARVKLIHTESEERKILECNSMKREIATTQIAAGIILGHEPTTQKYERCKMPMTMNQAGETLDCVTCSAAHRRAKHAAKQKRKKMDGSSCAERDTCEFVRNDCGTKQEKNEISAPSISERGLDKENESITILEETKNLTALEEGLIRSSSRIDGYSFEGEANSHGDSRGWSSANAPHARSSSSTIGWNANGVKPVSSSESMTFHQIGDYWARHSSSQLSSNQRIPTGVAAWHSNSQDQTFPGEHGESGLNDPLRDSDEVSCSNSSVQCHGLMSGLFLRQDRHSVLPLMQRLATVPSRKMTNPEDAQVIGSAGRLYESSSGTFRGSTAEISDYHGSSMLNEPGAFQSGDPLNQHNQQSVVASTESCIRYSRSNLYQGSLSEVSDYHRSSSAESCTRCPHNLSSSEMIYHPVLRETHQTHCDNGNWQHESSVSEVSVCQMTPAPIKYRCSDSVLPSNMSTEAAEEQTYHCYGNRTQQSYHGSSDESSTRCPRDLPSSEMIWHYESPNGTSERAEAVHPAQRIAGEHTNAALADSPNNPNVGNTQQQPAINLEGHRQTRIEHRPELIYGSNIYLHDSAENPGGHQESAALERIMNNDCRRVQASQIAEEARDHHTHLLKVGGRENLDVEVRNEDGRALPRLKATQQPTDLEKRESFTGHQRGTIHACNTTQHEPSLSGQPQTSTEDHSIPICASNFSSNHSARVQPPDRACGETQYATHNECQLQASCIAEEMPDCNSHPNGVQRNSKNPDVLVRKDVGNTLPSSKAPGKFAEESQHSQSDSEVSSVASQTNVHEYDDVPLSEDSLKKTVELSITGEFQGRRLLEVANDVSNAGSLGDRITRLADSLKEVASQLPRDDGRVTICRRNEVDVSGGSPERLLQRSDQLSTDELQAALDDLSLARGFQGENDSVNLNTEPSRESKNGFHCLTRTVIASLRGKNSIGISISPITVGRDVQRFHLFHESDDEVVEETAKIASHRRKPSQQSIEKPSQKDTCEARLANVYNNIVVEQRADPPGHRMEYCCNETRDPPDGSTARRGRLQLDPLELDPTANYIDDQLVTPRGQRIRIRDVLRDKQPSNKFGSTRPASNCTTPKSSGRAKKSGVRTLDSVQRDPSWGDNEFHAPIETVKSWGDSSMGELFKKIDEIEDDFHTIVASLPGSESQTTLSNSTKSMSEKHSLVEITLDNTNSFDSHSSADSIVTDVVQRMRRIKDYIERIDSGDEGGGSDSGDYDSQGEMSELILRLTNAAETLRAFDTEWDD